MNIETLREFCLKLPAVSEDIKWGHNLCLMVGGKIFLMADIEGAYGVAFKVSEEEFEELSDRDGIIQAPYLAKKKWVKVIDENCLSKKEWEHFILQSYEVKKATLTKKILREHNLV